MSKIHTPGLVPADAMARGFSPSYSSPESKPAPAVSKMYTPGPVPAAAMARGFSPNGSDTRSPVAEPLSPSALPQAVSTNVSPAQPQRRQRGASRTPPIPTSPKPKPPSRVPSRVAALLAAETDDINLSDFENNQSISLEPQVQSAMETSELFGFSTGDPAVSQSTPTVSPARYATSSNAMPGGSLGPRRAIPRRDSILDDIRSVVDRSQGRAALSASRLETIKSDGVASPSPTLDVSRMSLWSVAETVYKDLPGANQNLSLAETVYKDLPDGAK